MLAASFMKVKRQFRHSAYGESASLCGSGTDSWMRMAEFGNYIHEGRFAASEPPFALRDAL